MSTRLLWITVALALAGSALAQDKWTLRRTASAGETFKYALQVDTEWSGSPLKFKATVVDKVVKLNDDGSLQVETQQTDPKVVLDGNEMDAPSELGTVTTNTISTAGTVLDMQGDMVSADAFRMAKLEFVAWPQQPVGIGDTWSVELKGDEEKGTVPVKLSYEVLGTETVGKRTAVRIKYTSEETEGSDPAKTEGTVWVDVATGLLIRREAMWTNVPIVGQLISGKVQMALMEEGVPPIVDTAEEAPATEEPAKDPQPSDPPKTDPEMR